MAANQAGVKGWKGLGLPTWGLQTKSGNSASSPSAGEDCGTHGGPPYWPLLFEQASLQSNERRERLGARKRRAAPGGAQATRSGGGDPRPCTDTPSLRPPLMLTTHGQGEIGPIGWERTNSRTTLSRPLPARVSPRTPERCVWERPASYGTTPCPCEWAEAKIDGAPCMSGVCLRPSRSNTDGAASSMPTLARLASASTPAP